VLNLYGNRVTAAGAEALAASPLLAGLTTLELAGNRIGTAGARALAASPHLGRLTRLTAGGGPRIRAVLARRFGGILAGGG
jgi:hypothetical protein